MNSDVRAPYATLTMRSLPAVSTPNGNPDWGPVGIPKESSLSRCTSLGPWVNPAITGASMATAKIKITVNVPPSANLSLRNRRQNSSHGERPTTC